MLGALGLVEGAALLGLAITTRHALDTVASPAPFAAGLALVAVAAFARVVQRGLGESLAQRYVRRARGRLLQRWLQAEARERAGMNRGALLLRLMGDLSAIGRWLSRGIGRLVAVVPVIVMLLGALAWIDPRLGLVAGLVLFAGSTISWLAGQRVESRVHELRRHRGRLASRASEAVDAAGVDERAAALEHHVDRLSRRVGAASVAAARSAGVLEALALATTAGAMLAVLAAGAFAGAAVSPGSLAAAVMTTGLLGRPVHELGRIHDTWRRYRVARAKLNAFLAPGPRLRALPGGLDGDAGRTATGSDE